jgi:YD repeat-containing protein
MGWQRIKDKAYNGQLRGYSASFKNGACEIGGATPRATLPVVPDRWTHNPTFSTRVLVRPNGERLLFRLAEPGRWVSMSDLPVTLTQQSDGWLFTQADGTQERYGLDGQIRQATTPDGRETRYTYNADNQLQAVTTPTGQRLTFEYANQRIRRVNAPGGSVAYAYDEHANLTQVTYPDGSTKHYRYEDTKHPHLLTGVINENGVRIATWAYNSRGRVVMNERAEGSAHYTFDYGRYGTNTLTDGAGAKRTYHYEVINGQLRYTEISGDRCDTCAHREDKKRSYNDKGHILSRTDWNGVTTRYERDPSGLELSRTEAQGTPQARTVTTEWDPKHRKPVRITEPNRVIEKRYDSAGRLLQQTERALP